ncbi:MAG: hypothetical protein EON54_26180 [Alcaligenaceae bacterium]|nr:MAG: hypothetical protein EON54_26180 [Alcaligenaceae bacterium]
MNEADLATSVARLMERVDYYLHCELDEEYDHEQPETARSVLQAALRTELLRASAIGVLSTVGAPTHPVPNSDTA